MKKEEPYREQAERLKQRIEKLNEKTDDYDSLPPRGELHRKKQAKTKFKVKYPVYRLLVLVFILLPIISFCIISYLHGNNFGVPQKVSENKNLGYETITIEKNANGGTEDSTNSKGNRSGDAGAIDGAQPSQAVSSPAAPAEAKVSGKDSDKNGNPAGSGAGTAQAKTGTAPASQKTIYYTVQAQDTLFKIAMKFYHSEAGEAAIQKSNHIQDNQVKEGQVLKITLSN